MKSSKFPASSFPPSSVNRSPDGFDRSAGGGVGPLLLCKNTSLGYFVYITEAVIVPMSEAEVGARIDTELGTDTPVRWYVVVVVHLAEGKIAWQCAFTLNTT